MSRKVRKHGQTPRCFVTTACRQTLVNAFRAKRMRNVTGSQGEIVD